MHSNISRHAACVFVPALLSVAAMPVCGQGTAVAFPSRPLQVITSEAGGGNDFGARMVSTALSTALGQQVVVVNRGGGNGMIAAETIVRANPDGHSLLWYGSNIWLMPFLRRSVTYDPVKDFAPVTLGLRAPIILVTHPSVTAKTAQELIAYAKANPGKLNYGSGASGSASQIATEMFKAMSGADLTKISYKGQGPMLNALIAGEVQVALATPGSVSTHIRSGRLKALAVTSAQPSPLLPGMPTLAASGLPGYEATSIVGMLAPAKTPPEVVQKLYQETAKVLARPEVKDRFLAVGIEAVGSTPEEFAATIKSEMTRLGKVIRDAGIRDE